MIFLFEHGSYDLTEKKEYCADTKPTRTINLVQQHFRY